MLALAPSAGTECCWLLSMLLDQLELGQHCHQSSETCWRGWLVGSGRSDPIRHAVLVRRFVTQHARASLLPNLQQSVVSTDWPSRLGDISNDHLPLTAINHNIFCCVSESSATLKGLKIVMLASLNRCEQAFHLEVGDNFDTSWRTKSDQPQVDS